MSRHNSPLSPGADSSLSARFRRPREPKSQPRKPFVSSPSLACSLSLRSVSPLSYIFLTLCLLLIALPGTVLAQPVSSAAPSSSLTAPGSAPVQALYLRLAEFTSAPATVQPRDENAPPAPASSSSSSIYPYMTTPPSVPTIEEGNGLGDGALGNAEDGDRAGASGHSSGNMSISTGGIIAMCVGIVIVMIVAGATWYLWYIAKKRSWTVRQSLRHTSRRLTGLVRPSTRGRDEGQPGPAPASGRPSTRNAVKLINPPSALRKGPDGRSQVNRQWPLGSKPSTPFQSDPEKGNVAKLDKELGA